MVEPIGLVARLHDVAVMRQAIEQRSRHFGVAKDPRPLCEGEVGRDHHAGVLVELGEQVKQQRAARLTEGQIAQFIDLC